MRFSLHTSDGLGFVIKDRGKVFARGVLAGQIRRVIAKRVAGDEWRVASEEMCASWRGHANQHYKQTIVEDEWDGWARIRGGSWRTRSKAVVNSIDRGAYRPSGDLHIQSRVNKRRSRIDTWDQACSHMASNYRTEWSKKDEWHKWTVNTASNQRKRLRAKAERAQAKVWCDASDAQAAD